MENKDAIDFNSWANSVLNGGENKSNNFSVDALINDATKLPESFYGTYNTSDYKKYLGSSAVEEVGINPGWSNREFEVKFDEAQPYTEAFANTISKFADITKDATVNYFEAYYTGADDLITANEKRARENSNKGFSDPTFTSSTKSGLGSILSTDFYENLFPSLGYIVGTMGPAVLENIAVDILTEGAGAIPELINSGRKVKNALSYLFNIDKIHGALKAEQALTGMQKFKAGAQMYNMINGVRSEAAMEGGNNAFETSEKMKKDFKDKYGYEPFGEDLNTINEYAKSAGKLDYMINVPILMASNLIQFADLLLPEVVKISQGLEDSWKGYNLVNKGTALAPQLELEQKTFSELWNSAKGLEKVKAVAQYTADTPAFKYLTSAGSEGMEESLQRTASTLSQDYYTNKLKGTENAWDSTKLGLGEMFNDEGVQEFLGGFMIGSLSHAKHGAISVANKISDSFKKKEDRPVRLSEKEIEFEKMKEKVNYLNDTSLDKVLKSDGIKDAFVNGQLSREIKSFSKTGDIFNLKNAQDHALLNYLWAGYKTGKLDYRLNELEKIANLDYDKQDLATMLGVSISDLNDKRGSQAVRNIIDKVKTNKVNFQAVEDYFEKNSNVGELREQYNNDSNELSNIVAGYVNKYKGKSFDEVVDKLSEKETTDLLVRQVKLEESKANLIAYNEGVKVAAFAYAGLQNDKKRQSNIFDTLSTRSKLDYYGAKQLMNVRVAQDRKKELQDAIKTAKQIKDPQLKNYERQLELVEKIIEEHEKDQFMSPDKMANHLQEYAHASLPEAERSTIKKDAILMNDIRHLSDAVKLEKKNRRNVELYDYLMDIKNFSNYNRKITSDILNFRNKTIDWYLRMQEKPETTAAANTTTTTTTTTTPAQTKFKKGDRVTYEGTVYTIGDSVDAGNNVIAYSLVDNTGEFLVDEQDVKKYVKESELESLLPPPPPPPAGSSNFDDIEKSKEDAINEFVKNNPIYKKEEIEFTTEKTPEGKTINKVISNNPTDKGTDLSNKSEFKALINHLNSTQEKRDEEEAKRKELNEKIKEFNNKKLKEIEGVESFTPKERLAHFKDIKQFLIDNGLPASAASMDGVIKELFEILSNIPVIENPEEEIEETDYIPSTYQEGARADSPLKTVVQEEETTEINTPNGTRKIGTGKIAEEHKEGTYKNFVQKSLSNIMFLDGFNSVEGVEPMYRLVMVRDNADYDYERSAEFEQKLKAGKVKYGSIIIVADKEGNPVRFNDDYSISDSATEGRMIAYTFPFVFEKNNQLMSTSFDSNAAIQRLTKTGYTEEEAREIINRELDILNYLRNHLMDNPDAKIELAFINVSKGVILGNQVENNAAEFLKDEDFELEVVKDENAKGSALVPFRNTDAINGSLVAVVKVNGEDVVIRVNPNELSDNLREEINTILAHDFTLANGSVDKNINKTIDYLNALLYTRKDGRHFTIEKNKIYYVNENGEKSSILPDEKFLLNVASKKLNERVEKPKFTKTDKLSLATNDKGVTFETWDYNKFILNNSKIRGVKSEGKIRRVNAYINFDVPVSTLEDTGYIDLKEEPVVTTSDIEAKKADIEKRRQEELKSIDGIKKISKGKTSYAWKTTDGRSVFSYNDNTSEEVIEKINTKYDEELARELYKEMKAGKLVTDMTKEEQAVADKYITEELRNSVDKEMGSSEKGANDVNIEDDSLEDNPDAQVNENDSDDEITRAAKDGAAKLFSQEDDDEDFLNRKKETIGELASHLMKKNEYEFLVNLVGKDNIVNLFNIANSDAWAKWTTAGVTLWSNPKRGTGYHEAWHHFSQLYLTKKQKIALYNKVRKDVSGLKDASNLEVEEYLADDFMEFMLSGGKESKLFKKNEASKSIFHKIWEVLKALFGNSNTNINHLYDSLRLGNLKSYKPSVNNAMWGKLERAIYNNEGAEVMSSAKVATYVQTADAFIGDILKRKRSDNRNLRLLDLYSLTSLLNDSDKLSAIYSMLRSEFLDLSNPDRQNGLTKKVKADLSTLARNNSNWSNFVKEHVRANKIGISQDTDIDIEETFGSAEQEFSEKIHDKASNSEDLFKLAPQEIKKLLSFIQKKTAKIANGRVIIESVTDPTTGLPVLSEQRNLYDRLSVELNGLDTIEEMVNKLRDPLTQLKVPEALDIIEFLPLNPGKDLSKLKMLSTFVQAFTNPYVAAVYGIINKDGEFALQEATRLGEEELKKTYLDNFNSMRKNTTYVKTGVVQTDGNGINYITDKVNNLDFDFNSKNDVVKFLSLIGVRFDSDILNDRNIFAEFKRSITTEDLKRFFTEIKRRTAFGYPSLTANPIIELAKSSEVIDEERDENVKIPSNFTVIKKILAFANKYNHSNPSTSYFNAEGELEYGFQKHNGFTQRIAVINKVNSAKELRNTPGFENFDFENNPHVRGSEWANLLFDFSKPNGPKRIDKRTGEKVKLNILNYNGFEINKGGTKSKKSTANLSTREKFMLDMYSFLSSGVIDIPRTESATSFYSIHPSTYNPNSQNFSPLMISMSNVEISDNIFNQPLFIDTISKYLEAELYKIKNGKEIYGKLLDAEQFEKVVDFTLFKDILSDDLKTKLKKDIKATNDLNEVIANNIDEITNDVSKFFNEQKENVEGLFSEFNIQEKDLPKSMVKAERLKLNAKKREERKQIQKEYKSNPTLVKEKLKELDEKYKLEAKKIFGELTSKMSAAFTANHFIQAVEFSKFFEADLGYYKDYFKRSKGMNSTGSPSFIDSFRNEFMANTPSMANALDVSYAPEDFKKAKTITLKDDTRPSVSNNPKENKNKKIGTVPVTQMVHDTLMSIYLAKKKLNPNAKLSFTKKEIEAVEKSLYRYDEKANGADGQGLCTLDFYRFLKNNFANWSAEEEALYQSEVLKFKLHEGVFKTAEEISKAKKQIVALTKEAKGVTFPVIKVNYRGPANNKAFTPVMDKFSLAPMLIDSIKGTTLESVNKEMLKNKVGYAKFQSGTKIWAPALNDLYHNGTFTFVEGSIVDHYPEFIREQIQSNPKTKNKVTLSTQSRTLIFSDLYSNGVPNDFNGDSKKWNSLSNEQKLKSSSIEATKQRYQNNIDNIIEYHKNKLFEEIGVTREGDKLIINDQEKLISSIQKEVLKKGLNKNVEDYIIYDPKTGKSVLPLDYAQNRIGIGDIILSIIDNRVRKININGSQLIQIAGTGFEKTGKEIKLTKPTDKQLEEFGTNGLNFYYLKQDANGNWYTEPMGIKVSLNGDFKNLLNLTHPDGKVIGTRDRLNDIIKADINRSKQYQAWIDAHKDQLTVVGVRIPVGDTNFHDVMMIKEFLPEAQGDVIVLPHEATVKSGTDYDVDKMTFYRPVINSDGTLAKKYNKKEREEAEKQLDTLKKEFTTVVEKAQQSSKSVFDMFDNVSDIGKEKIKIYDKIKDLNFRINTTYKEYYALLNNKKDTSKEKEIRINEIDLELEILENRRTKLLSSMTELSVLQNEFFESTKRLKEIKSEIKTISNNLDDINHLTNEMIDIYKQILTDPTVFRKLITPSANEDFNEAADFIGNIVNRQVGKYENTKVLLYISSLRKGSELLKTKKLLGAFAKNNKYGPLYQIAGLGFNFYIPTGIYTQGGKELMKPIRTLLMTKDEETISRQNGYISLGNRLSFDGKNLQDLKSQGIVSTVDIASDPTFSRFGVNDENVGTFLLLLNLGVPLDQIAVFINQPSILAYTTAIVNEGSSKKDARNEIDKMLKEMISKKSRKNQFKDLSMLNSDIKERFEFKELLSYCKKEFKDMTVEELQRQREVFAHYFHMVELENGLRSLQSATSWDTSKLDSPISAYENFMGVREIQKSSMFNSEGLNKLLKHSFISNFNTNDIILKTFAEMFPVTNNNLVYSKLISSINSISDRGKKLAARRIIINDFVEAIVKTYGKYKGMNITEYADALQYYDKSEEADNSLIVADRLNELKEDPNNEALINEFPIINKLLPNINIDTRQVGDFTIKNIEIYRLMDATTEDQNTYIDQLTKLINHSDPKIADLFKDICILAFNQSGFNKSFLSFFDIVPFELFKPIFASAEGEYNKLSEEEEENFILAFSNAMIYENPQLFTAEYDDLNNTQSNLYYYRGKAYYIGKEQLESISSSKEGSDFFDELKELAELNAGTVVTLEPTKGNKFEATITGKVITVKPNEYVTLPDGRRALRSPAVYQMEIQKDDGSFTTVTKKSVIKQLITEKDDSQPKVKPAKKVTVEITDEKELAELNKHRDVMINFQKYDKPFRATVTGNVVKVVDESYRILPDGTKEKIGDPIYQMEFKTSRGKLITANHFYEVDGLVTTKEVDADTVAAQPQTSTNTQPTVFEKTNQNTSYSQETQDAISAARLSEGEYEVVKVNGVETVISKKNIPAKISPKSTKYYLGLKSGIVEERYGRKVTIPGYEDIDVYEDQISKRFYELSTSTPINIDSEDLEDAIAEIKNKFDKANIRDLLSSRVKTQINLPGSQVTPVNQAFTTPTVQDKRKTYLGKVTSLQPNQIFVFGSNEGSSKGGAPTHGAGSAKLAKDKFGAIQGQTRGLQGQSYAIVTKKFYDVEKSSTSQEIIAEIKGLYKFAKQNPNKEFLVSDYSETNLNGYTGQEMADMFFNAGPIPSNIVFNETFDKLITTPQTQVTATSSEKVYSQLGNKTKSENIVIKPFEELANANNAVQSTGIIATRISKTNYHFGNPFSNEKSVLAKNATLIPVNSTKEAVERYINWILTGETGWQNIELPEQFEKRTGRKLLAWEDSKLQSLAEDLDSRREWILEQLKSGKLKGKPIFYYKELGEPSHATALDYLINKYDWNKSTVQGTNNPAEYTNYSGGAYGADTYWDIVGREFGVTNHKHFREANNTNLSQKLKNNKVEATVLSKADMDKARAEVKRLLGEEYPDTLEGNLKVRNFYQVINSDAVFAVAQLADENGKPIRSYLYPTIKGVTGGTNTAVQLGIALNKPVYVWDLGLKSWFVWNGQHFTAMADVPVLTKNFAGVGTRDIENYNVKNKETNKWEPRKQYVGKQLEETAVQAIRDVYEKTFGKVEEPTIEIGRYVKYKGDIYIIVRIENDKALLYNAAKETRDKLNVSLKTLASGENKVLPNIAKIVNYRGNDYIVTKKETIISLRSGNKQAWSEDNGDRKRILELAQSDDGIKDNNESGEVIADNAIPAPQSSPLTFRELDVYDDDKKSQILTTFATKYKMTEEDAENYINQRLAEGKKDAVITELNKCIK